MVIVMVYSSQGAAGLHKAVAALEDVSTTRPLHRLGVAGVRVLDTVREAVLWLRVVLWFYQTKGGSKVATQVPGSYCNHHGDQVRKK
jgi:hypothetical protein